MLLILIFSHINPLKKLLRDLFIRKFHISQVMGIMWALFTGVVRITGYNLR
jgi:hypothetical protein